MSLEPKKTFPTNIWVIYYLKLDGVAPLITDPLPNSFNTLPEEIYRKKTIKLSNN